MSIPNRVTLDDLRTLSIGDIAALPAEELALLQQEAAELIANAKQLEDRLNGGLDLKYGERAAALRRDAGTARIEDSGFVVVADVRKQVKWEQTRLAAIVERIRAAGDDPAEYVTTELKVAERAYGAWPQTIRTAFAPARTVETSKPTFRLEPIARGVR